MSVRSIHQFAEKVALISNAEGPVGRAVAMQLALNGSYIVGLFQDEGGSVEELVELGTLAHAVKADPSTFAGASEAAAAVEKLFGRLDLLVNCLKFGPESFFENVTEFAFTDKVKRDLGSVYFLTNAVLDLMKTRPKPTIVNLVGTPYDDDPLSAACHAGVIALTRSFAKTLPSNFRVNCVEVKEAETARQNGEGSVLRSVGSVAPDDVARTVLFLLSSESVGMNGQTARLG